MYSTNTERRALATATTSHQFVDAVHGLFDYEIEALFAALRRDIRVENEKALSSNVPEYHHMNARYSQRILEALQPKTSNSIPAPR